MEAEKTFPDFRWPICVELYSNEVHAKKIAAYFIKSVIPSPSPHWLTTEDEIQVGHIRLALRVCPSHGNVVTIDALEGSSWGYQAILTLRLATSDLLISHLWLLERGFALIENGTPVGDPHKRQKAKFRPPWDPRRV